MAYSLPKRIKIISVTSLRSFPLTQDQLSLDFRVRESPVCQKPSRPLNWLLVESAVFVRKNAHLLKVCTQTLTRSKHGCAGIPKTTSSSFAVGIHRESLPPSTSMNAANSSKSSSMASKLYGFFGGMYLSCLPSLMTDQDREG